jgi:hypothetical protein
VYFDLKLKEQDIIIIQIEGFRRQIFITFEVPQKAMDCVTQSNATLWYIHSTGEWWVCDFDP